jgi:hypothetical protein
VHHSGNWFKSFGQCWNPGRWPPIGHHNVVDFRWVAKDVQGEQRVLAHLMFAAWNERRFVADELTGRAGYRSAWHDRRRIRASTASITKPAGGCDRQGRGARSRSH